MEIKNKLSYYYAAGNLTVSYRDDFNHLRFTRIDGIVEEDSDYPLGCDLRSSDQKIWVAARDFSICLRKLTLENLEKVGILKEIQDKYLFNPKDFSIYNLLTGDFNSWPWEIFQLLLKYSFDVFDLEKEIPNIYWIDENFVMA